MIDRVGIAALIPQAGLMCLLDKVERWDDRSITCLATTHRAPGNPLVLAGKLGAICGLEYAGQAMAVHGALTGAVGGKPKGNHFVALSGVTLFVARLDDIAGALVIEAERLAEAGQQTIYGFTIASRHATLLRGRAAIVLDPAAR